MADHNRPDRRAAEDVAPRRRRHRLFRLGLVEVRGPAEQRLTLAEAAEILSGLLALDVLELILCDPGVLRDESCMVRIASINSASDKPSAPSKAHTHTTWRVRGDVELIQECVMGKGGAGGAGGC